MLFEEAYAASGAKPHGQGDEDDGLLVFGYGCKLFRDDDTARRVNRGETLIPWQGDKSLMIDRSASSIEFKKFLKTTLIDAASYGKNNKI